MFLAESSIQLVPDGTLLIHILIIAIMVTVLNRTLLKPINEILARRDALLSGRLNEAQVLEAAREEKLREYDAALRQARTEGYHLLETEKTASLRERDRRLSDAKAELSKEVTSAVQATHQQEEILRKELELEAQQLSGLIEAQVLRRPSR